MYHQYGFVVSTQLFHQRTDKIIVYFTMLSSTYLFLTSFVLNLIILLVYDLITSPYLWSYYVLQSSNNLIILTMTYILKLSIRRRNIWLFLSQKYWQWVGKRKTFVKQSIPRDDIFFIFFFLLHTNSQTLIRNVRFTSSFCVDPLRLLLGLVVQSSEDLQSQIVSGGKNTKVKSINNADHIIFK